MKQRVKKHNLESSYVHSQFSNIKHAEKIYNPVRRQGFIFIFLLVVISIKFFLGFIY